MKILLIKMSSMGDIFHTFPAITDLKNHYPNAEIHWVVEAGFAEIATWHPGVTRVIPIHLRRWMKSRKLSDWCEFKAWKAALQTETYDYIVDAQGLLKSALIGKCAKGKGIQGFDKKSAREAISHWFYASQYRVAKEQHAVERTRELFANIFQYPRNLPLNFGINEAFAQVQKDPRKLIFIIGTSWVTKLWAQESWIALTQLALAAGYRVEIMWGSAEEMALAQEIIDQCPGAYRPQARMSITTVAEKLVESAGIVGLDTGFSHLAGALEIPTIAVYGPTSPAKVGLIGPHTLNMQLSPALPCMPCHKRQCKWLPENSSATPECMTKISAQQVWAELQGKINTSAQSIDLIEKTDL